MDQLTPPQAAVRPHELTIHGQTRLDDYFWLRQREEPEVLAYLEAENAYTEAAMGHTQALQEKLYQEMVGRIQETDSTAPAKDGEYFYYSRTEEGKQYEIHCRQRGSLDAPEEVLLDLNGLAEGQKYLRLGIFEVSPNGRLLAYSTDTEGNEQHTLQVKDLTSGELLPERIPHTSFTAQWANDNQTLFYTTHDEAWRSDKLFRHTVGADPAGDRLILHEPDELFRVFIQKSKDRAYLFLLVYSIETTEIRYLDANAPRDEFAVIQPRQKGMRYTVAHHGGTFYILTNENAPNYKVMTAAVGAHDKGRWREWLGHRQDLFISDIEPFANHLVLHSRENGLSTLHVFDMRSGEWHRVDFPEPVYTYSRDDNPEFETNRLRFTYSSLTTADSVYDYDMDSRERELRKRKPVLGGYEPADYQSERIFALAEDGTAVPISLLYRQGMVRDGRNPCLLTGYGSYGASYDPHFNANRLSLVNRGLIFAVVHVRGGQEMGRAWYDQGKFLNKKNSFSDFIAAARHLIAEGFTGRDHLAITGRSAGGLLMGAVVTMAPELFKVVVAGVPFVDVVTTMLDASIPLTAGEWEEWGNPADQTYYEYMLSYSPYDNTTARPYPHLLVTAGLNDPRVQYWEPAKWVAKLRRVTTGDRRLLLKTFMGAGHFSSSGRYAYLRDLAFEFAFMLDCLGIGE